MDREPAQSPNNPVGGNNAPLGDYGLSAQNPGQGDATASFRSTDIVNTQAAQEKEYFQPDEEGGRWARLQRWLKEHRKAALAILLGILVLLGLLIWLIVWLVSSATTGDETVPTEWIGEVTEEDENNAIDAMWNVADLAEDPTVTDDELVTAINAELDTLTTESSRFRYLLVVAYRLATGGHTELGFEYLDTIDIARLDNTQLFMYYSYYAAIYEQLGDEEQTNYYLELMDAIDLGITEEYGA